MVKLFITEKSGPCINIPGNRKENHEMLKAHAIRAENIMRLGLSSIMGLGRDQRGFAVIRKAMQKREKKERERKINND